MSKYLTSEKKVWVTNANVASLLVKKSFFSVSWQWERQQNCTDCQVTFASSRGQHSNSTQWAKSPFFVIAMRITLQYVTYSNIVIKQFTVSFFDIYTHCGNAIWEVYNNWQLRRSSLYSLINWRKTGCSTGWSNMSKI